MCSSLVVRGNIRLKFQESVKDIVFGSKIVKVADAYVMSDSTNKFDKFEKNQSCYKCDGKQFAVSRRKRTVDGSKM